MSNQLTIRPEHLERLRQICLALPEVSEKQTWGDPTWRVRDRIFAMQKGNFPGGRPSVWFKAHDGAQLTIVGSFPDRFLSRATSGTRGGSGPTSTGAE